MASRPPPGLILPNDRIVGPRNQLKGPGRTPGPPVIRPFTKIPRLPTYLYVANLPNQQTGPGEPPPGFVTATTSATEWIAYWALSKIFKNPLDPRQWPYIGGWPDWGYQIGLDGTRANAVVDFMIMRPANGRRLGIRIVTEYWHNSRGSAQVARDQFQAAGLLRYIDIVDVQDADLLRDKTGEQAIIRLKAALGMIQTADPILSGTVQRTG